MLKKAGLAVLATLSMLVLMHGCTGIGPKTVTRDRFNYIEALSDSWKKQMLLNLVKIRYVDAPVFLEVASVISQYEVVGQVDLELGWSNSLVGGDSQTVGGSGTYSDRPTVTYTPLVGEKFTRSLMTPIPVEGILSLIQADYPVNFILRICVQTINNIDNRSGGGLDPRPADPKFYELIEALRKVQQSGKLGMRVKSIGEDERVVMFFRAEDADEDFQEDNVARKILGLDPDAAEFRVVYGAIGMDDRELAMLTRSMLQIMIELGSYVEVPAKDVDEGRVAAGFTADEASDVPPLIRIHSGASSPKDAFVAVPYRDNWFWIDDTDLPSKRIFSFLMMLFSLTETGDRAAAPIVTVPTN
ncbi:MAG: hypothetical protein JRF69_10265 [Deltaproteobacteria bacterium]|nr:hypothetical protein [Deltaproteobacteria bacterium]